MKAYSGVNFLVIGKAKKKKKVIRAVVAETSQPYP